MKQRHSESGFSAIGVLLVVVILAILGLAGYFVYHAYAAHHKTVIKPPAVTDFQLCKQAADSKILQTDPEQCVTKSGVTFTDIILSTKENYLNIKEWGIKLGLTDADKMTYTAPISADGAYGTGVDGQVVGLYLKPTFTSLKDCQGLGYKLYRDTTQVSGETNTQTTLNGYTYFIDGGPGACMEGNPSLTDPVTNLRVQIEASELGSDQYTITALN
jgi:hypothetical protein